jgi:hypothetical protein
METKEIIQRDRLDVEWITSTEQGRRFMWRLLSYCGVYRDIEGNGNDMLKQIGRRQVGLYLLGLVADASEERIFDMMREAKERSIEEKLHYERTNRDTESRTVNIIDDIIGGVDTNIGGGSEGIF